MKLLDVFRRTAGEILLHLCPDEFDRVEFRRTGRKSVNMDLWMMSQKLSDFLTAVNGRLVPHQDDGASHPPQQLPPEVDDLVTGQVACIRLGTQSDGAFTWCDQ